MNIAKKSNPNYYGFTIVELLVVIVVIAILATITIVSFTGILQKATASSLQSDLSNASKLLKMYYTDHGVYPVIPEGSNCPSKPTEDPKYCLKPSSGNTFAYSPNTGTTGASTYELSTTNNNTNYSYMMTSDSESFVTPPTYIGNGVASENYNVTSTSPGVPVSAMEGDLMLAFVFRLTWSEPVIPTGWTLVAQNKACGLYSKTASASEPSSYSWSWGTTSKHQSVISAYRFGTKGGVIADVSNTFYEVGDTTVRASDIVTNSGTSLLVTFGYIFNGGAGLLPATNPVGFTERYDNGGGFSDSGVFINTAPWSKSGAAGNIDVVSTRYAVTNKHAIAVALQNN